MMMTAMKPSVPKCWLFVLSGVMWSSVGGLMCLRAARWLVDEAGWIGWLCGGIGVLAATVAWRLIFSGLARKNIRRLRKLPERGCFFAFQAWSSYLIIAFMIALGIGLRRSPIPTHLLAILYMGIGGALFVASGHYYRHLARLLRVARR